MQQIFVSRIPSAVSTGRLEGAIADRLHNPPVSAKHRPSGGPLNFDLVVFTHKMRGSQTKSGRLIIPDNEAAAAFLQSVFRQPVRLHGCNLSFKYDTKGHPDSRVVKRLLASPHQDPELRRRNEATEGLIQGVPLTGIQLGGRDGRGQFVIEADICGSGARCLASSGTAKLDHERKYLLLGLTAPHLTGLAHVAIPIRAIDNVYIDTYYSDGVSNTSVLLLCAHPVSLERRNPAYTELEALFNDLRIGGRQSKTPPWYRLSELPTWEAQSPYVLFDVRITGMELSGVFDKLCYAYRMDPPICLPFKVSSQAEYTNTLLDKFQATLLCLPMPMAYQAQKLLSNVLLKPAELLEALPYLLRRFRGRTHTAALALLILAEHPDLEPVEPSAAESTVQSPFILRDLLEQAANLAEQDERRWGRREDAYHRVGHVQLTPTGMSLRGPLPDVSNRVLRRFSPDEHHNFVRITFCEEDVFGYFSNQGIYDVRTFVAMRFGGAMKTGVTIGGRVFDFLAYSQSSLKDYTVWFVTPFVHEGNTMTADTIRMSLGDFSKTIRLVAKYAARLSQAFTTTHSSVRIRADQVESVPDVTMGRYIFTDGCGSISPKLADEIIERLFRNGRASAVYASAFQIRFAGCKGMLFVNPALSGSKITIRNSMRAEVDQDMSELLDWYSDIAYDYKLTEESLDEAELFIGALVAPRKGRKRRIMLADANKDLTYLLDDVRLEIGPDKPAQASISEWRTALASAYAAWQISLERLDRFGSCSFNMLAFEAMFRCIDKLSSLEG